jgi:hypothetical protein
MTKLLKIAELGEDVLLKKAKPVKDVKNPEIQELIAVLRKYPEQVGDMQAKLNEMITSLSKNEIDYKTFYEKIRQYRVDVQTDNYNVGTRARIETQRKRDWRRREAKDTRNARHKRR